MHRFHEELKQIEDLLQGSPHGMSITEISQALSKNKHSVGRYLDILQAFGKVEMRSYGMARVYTLSRRLPLSSIISCSNDLFALIDPDGHISQINDSFLDLLSCSRAEVIGKNIRFLQGPDTGVTDLINEIAMTLEKGESPECLAINSEPKRYFRPRYIPSILEDGSSGTIIILDDITEKVNAHFALMESEALFRGLAENTKDGVIISEGEGPIYCNSRVEEISGYSREEILSADPLEYVVPEDRAKMEKISSQFRESGKESEEIRVWIQRKDGERRYLLCRLSKVDYAGKVRYYIVLTDMTEWKERDDAIHNQFVLIKHLMDAFPRPLYYIDGEGILQGCNSAFEKITGVKRHLAIGKPLNQVFHEDISGLLMKGIDNHTLGGSSFSHNGRMVFNDGSIHDLIIEKAVISWNNGNKGWLIGILVE